MIYGLGFWEEIARYETQATDFLLVVDQPRARGSAGTSEEETDESEALEATNWGGEWRVTLDEMLDFGDRLKTGYDIATQPGAWLRAGPWCQFCPRKGSCDEFARRAQAWRHLLDPETRFFRPRRNGQWLTPYDPRRVDFHHTEANGWQYRFAAPHHASAHVKALGGDDAFEAALDSLFTTDSATTGRDQADKALQELRSR